MHVILGLDVGTTSLSAVAMDADLGRVLAQRALPNRGVAYETLSGGLQQAELDLVCSREQLIELLSQVVDALPAGHAVSAIGVTGQQHGVALLDRHLQPVRPAITWQDQRTLTEVPDSGRTWVQAYVDQAGGPESFERMGLTPAAGFMGPSLFWLQRHGALDEVTHVCLIPDAAVSLLTNTPPSTDATDAGSSALFDIVGSRWAWDVIDRLGLPRGLFPPVRPAGRPHALLDSDVAARVGLGRVPVCVAAGDNQASFVGSIRDPEHSVLVNVGTGGQVSALVPAYARVAGVETRAFFGQDYLLVGAGLYGGRAYAYLRDFYRATGAAFYGRDDTNGLYDTMNRLAATVPPGSDGLVFTPLFTGTRDHPDQRARIEGIGPANFTPAHLARALLEGIAEGFWELYAAMLPVTGARSTLVGAGNGISRNPVLAEILARRFGLDLHVANGVETAALGAALLAADGTGHTALRQGMERVTYDDVITG